MAHNRELTWAELRVGVFVLVGILVVMLGIFYVTGTGFLGAKYRLVTYLPEVDGLAPGARVTLDGVEVGNVDSIQIARPKAGETPNSKRSVEVVLRLSRDFQSDIRSDSSATLITQGFLGDRVVSLQRGYTGSESCRTAKKSLASRTNRSRRSWPTARTLCRTSTNSRSKLATIVVDVQRGRGTLGALLTDRTAYDHANKTLARVDQMAASIQQDRERSGKL